MSSEKNEMKWYVVRAASGREAKAMSLLKNQIMVEGQEDKFGEILVPTEEVVELKSGQRKTSQRKFFPGYILVQVELSDEVWQLIKSVPHILGFIGGLNAKPLPQAEVDKILNRMQSAEDSPKPKTLYTAGEMVRVTDGPFAEFNGVVKDVNMEKQRLVVSVFIFGRSTPVELEFSQVEKENG